MYVEAASAGFSLTPAAPLGRIVYAVERAETVKYSQFAIIVAAGLLGGLASRAHAQSVLYRGFSHTPLGAASLTLDPNDTILVGNIGSSGLDGASVDLGESEFWDGRLHELPAAAPTGAFFELTATGVPSGSSRQTLSVIRFDKTGAGYILSTSFPFIGSPPVNVTVFDGDTVVAAATGLTGPLAQLTPAEHRYDPVRAAGGRVSATLSFTLRISITVTGQPTVLGDRIIVNAINPTTIDFLDETQIRAAGLGSFRVTDEMIGKFGYAHRAFGQATLRPAGVCPAGTLTVGNIGATGDDGVHVEFENADGFDIDWTPFAAGAPDGAYLSFSAEGSVSGGAVQAMGAAQIQDVGATLQFTADLSPVGAFAKTVEAYSGGSLVGRVTGLTAPVVATVDDLDWPAGGGAHLLLTSDHLPGWRFVWNAAVSVDLFGGPTVLADEIVIGGENPSVPLDFIATIDGDGSDIPDLEITGEDTDPTCFNDLDGDNEIGLGDLATLLANYGTMGGASHGDGDLDSDGDVDLADLAALLADYGSPC